MKTITFLGPIGATFSHDAYELLAKLFGARSVATTDYIPAPTNEEVLGLAEKHGGYGALAMETLAQGRVAEGLESFFDLQARYDSGAECPLHVIGAVRMPIHFCLMARPDVTLPMLTHVVGHEKALGACAKKIGNMGSVPKVPVESNGTAAFLVSNSAVYQHAAALGPCAAAEKYDLNILDRAFEDKPAVTTFFLIGPVSHKVSVGKFNRALVIFMVSHESGALYRALVPFDRWGLNLSQIHSVYAGDHAYRFAVEIEIADHQLAIFEPAMDAFRKRVEKHLCFGPFEIRSV